MDVISREGVVWRDSRELRERDFEFWGNGSRTVTVINATTFSFVAGGAANATAGVNDAQTAVTINQSTNHFDNYESASTARFSTLHPTHVSDLCVISLLFPGHLFLVLSLYL